MGLPPETSTGESDWPSEAQGLAARFAVEQVFAGGEGWTARVRPEGGGEPLLLKVLPPGEHSEEASLLTGLRHPAVPSVLEVGTTHSGARYTVRQFVAGTSLSEQLPLATADARQLACDALEALAYVHMRGVLHLDLKPANIVFDRARRPSCSLLDFGMGRRALPDVRARSGTPIFASPEQTLGLPADRRSDIYSLGVVLFVALRGAAAVPVQRFLRVFPQQGFFDACGFDPTTLPAPFDTVLPRMLARRPAARFADAQEALEALDFGAGAGRPRLHALQPDPLQTWGERIEAGRLAARDGPSLRVRGGSETDRQAVAVQLACVLDGVAACRSEGDAWVVERDPAARSVDIELPPLESEQVAGHLRRVVGLDAVAADRAAEWVLARTASDASVGDVLEGLVRAGQIVPHGLGWLWPAAEAGRLQAPASAPEATVATMETAASEGRVDQAQFLYETLSAARPADEADLRRRLAVGLLRCGDAARALTLCKEDDALRARALLDMGRVEDAARIPLELRPGPLSEVEIKRLRGQIAHASGDRASAVDHMRRLLADSQEPEDVVVAVPVLAALGEIDDGVGPLTAALAALEAQGARYLAAVAANNLAVLHRAAGRFDEAKALYLRARELFFAVGHARAAATAALNVGILAKDLGDHPQAIAELRRAHTIFSTLGDRAGAALAIGGQGSAALAQGDWKTAATRLGDAVEQLAGLGAREHLPLLRSFLALALAHLGQRERALQVLDAVGTTAGGRLASLRAEVDTVLRGALPAATDPPLPIPNPPENPPMPSPSQGISRERFRTFVAVNRRLATEVDLEKAMQYVTECAVSMTGGRRGYVVLQHDGHLSLECEAGEGGGKRAFSRTMANRAIQEQRTLTEGDIVGIPGLLDMPSVQDLQVRSAICAPFESATGAKGALFVEHGGRSGVFGEADKEDLEILADQVAIAVDRMIHADQLRAELQHSRQELALARRESGRRKRPRMIGKSPAIEAMLQEIHRIADSDLSVLITGETGSGKELVARALHDGGRRARGPFVSENCSALPPELMESELFGHEKGAFTGAEDSRPGLLELADGGTLFLDEVGDMPAALQAKLLRALQEQSIRRVGGSKQIAVDLRLLSATHKDLRQLVEDGSFREDLFYRLAAVELRVPPLRDRGQDVVLLAKHFLDRLNNEHSSTKTLAAPVEQQLLRYPWPGNVRELEHVLARAFLLADGSEIADLQLPAARPVPAADAAAGGDGGAAAPAEEPVLTMREAEQRAIERALVATDGDKSKAARLLGISRTALYDKLKRFG